MASIIALFFYLLFPFIVVFCTIGLVIGIGALETIGFVKRDFHDSGLASVEHRGLGDQERNQNGGQFVYSRNSVFVHGRGARPDDPGEEREAVSHGDIEAIVFVVALVGSEDHARCKGKAGGVQGIGVALPVGFDLLA
ncbi:hypothetical protein PG996_004670 [Apiospora saccharicola]|uniref:Uncharacterized protein n=1 Tax=Apiospora saccharicola TaxID=335842 RepID=A0ABR1W7L9_9PEZI